MVLGPDGKVIGQIGKDGNVYDANGNIVGRVNENGDIVDANGNVIRKAEDVVRGPNGEVIGQIGKDGNVYDANGNIVGRVNENGDIVDANGNVIRKADVVLGPDGKAIGQIGKDGNVYDANGNIVGRVNENGDIVDANGNVIRKAEDVVRGPNGEVIGQIGKDGNVYDANGNIIGRVNENGDIVDANGNVIRKADGTSGATAGSGTKGSLDASAGKDSLSVALDKSISAGRGAFKVASGNTLESSGLSGDLLDENASLGAVLGSSTVSTASTRSQAKGPSGVGTVTGGVSGGVSTGALAAASSSAAKAGASASNKSSGSSATKATTKGSGGFFSSIGAKIKNSSSGGFLGKASKSAERQAFKVASAGDTTGSTSKASATALATGTGAKKAVAGQGEAVKGTASGEAKGTTNGSATETEELADKTLGGVSVTEGMSEAELEGEDALVEEGLAAEGDVASSEEGLAAGMSEEDSDKFIITRGDTDKLPDNFVTSKEISAIIKEAKDVIVEKDLTVTAVVSAKQLKTLKASDGKALVDVSNDTESVSLWIGTKKQYDALETKEKDVIYCIGSSTKIKELAGNEKGSANTTVKKDPVKTSFGYGQVQNTYQLHFASLGEGTKTGVTPEGVLIVPESISLRCDSLNYEDATKDKKMDSCLKKMNDIITSEVSEELRKADIDSASKDIYNGYIEYLTATYFEALEIYNDSLTFKNNELDPITTTSTSDIDGSWRVAKEMHIVLGSRFNKLHKLWARNLSMKMYSKYVNEKIKNDLK